MYIYYSVSYLHFTALSSSFSTLYSKRKTFFGISIKQAHFPYPISGLFSFSHFLLLYTSPWLVVIIPHLFLLLLLLRTFQLLLQLLWIKSSPCHHLSKGL